MNGTAHARYSHAKTFFDGANNTSSTASSSTPSSSSSVPRRPAPSAEEKKQTVRTKTELHIERIKSFTVKEFEQMLPHERLGLHRDCTEEQCVQVRRILAKAFHPDKCRDDPGRALDFMKLVGEAFDILTNVSVREKFYFDHDEKVQKERAQENVRTHSGNVFADVFKKQFGDEFGRAFNMFFGANAYTTNQETDKKRKREEAAKAAKLRRPEDTHIHFDLTFAESALGCKRTVAYSKRKVTASGCIKSDEKFDVFWNGPLREKDEKRYAGLGDVYPAMAPADLVLHVRSVQSHRFFKLEKSGMVHAQRAVRISEALLGFSFMLDNFDEEKLHIFVPGPVDTKKPFIIEKKGGARPHSTERAPLVLHWNMKWPALPVAPAFNAMRTDIIDALDSMYDTSSARDKSEQEEIPRDFVSGMD